MSIWTDSVKNNYFSLTLLRVFARYSVFHKKKNQKVGLLGKVTGASHEEKSERKNKLQDLVQRIDMSYCSKLGKTKWKRTVDVRKFKVKTYWNCETRCSITCMSVWFRETVFSLYGRGGKTVLICPKTLFSSDNLVMVLTFKLLNWCQNQ
jgi:hypothetical protein